MRPLFSFADVQVVIADFSTQFGRFFEPMCEDTTQTLIQLERRGTGRVSLSSFHASTLAGNKYFTESAEYLRQLGVLDESSVLSGPQVIISNYMQSPNNCVITQKHFRVCCANPCHDFFSDLEVAIGAPEGAPEDIMAIVSNTTSGLNDASPRITRRLEAQLREIAQEHQGKVPLHGRLFAQWLHFVFPTECPFPHKSNSVIGLSAEEFGEFEATKEEMQENVRRGEDKARAAGMRSADGERQGQERDADELMDLWSHEEELLVERAGETPPSALLGPLKALRLALCAVATLSVFVVGVLRPATQLMADGGKSGDFSGSLVGGGQKAGSSWETKAHFV